MIELILGTASGAVVARRIGDPGETLHAPHLIDLEVTQVLRRYWLTGEISQQRAIAARRDFADLDIVRYAHDMILDRIWDLKGNLTAYDAAYVVLAEALDAPLLTSDKRLQRVPGVQITVEIP